jgi:hypothetical protein
LFAVTALSACNLQRSSTNDLPALNEPVLNDTAVPELIPTGRGGSIETPLPTPRPRRLNAGELQLAADIDDIPAIFAEDDLFVDAQTGSQEWVDEELVIGVVINDDARAYPIRLLSSHEIVNDTVGGEPVMVTWCPLCFTAIVFDRVVEGQELTFGVSGYLYFNNLVMYDHRTNTLWSQVLGQAIRGAHRGQRLGVRPSQMTSWGEWKGAYPETEVLSAERLGNRAEDIIDPYAGYYNSGSAGVTGWANPNNLLPVKELVVGLTIGQQARAYPLALVREVGLIQDELATVPVLLVYDAGLGSVIVYRRETAESVLNFLPAASDGHIQDVETGSIWAIRNGRALQGAMEGNELSRLAAPLVYWFAWSDIHADSDIYRFSPEK